MRSEEIRDLAIQALDDMKGEDIVAIDVKSLTSITDFMVICTGRSNRHVKALADSVAVKAKENHLKFVHTEGERESEWILVDLGDIVVHIMTSNTRSFYSLEELWEPVKDLRGQQSNS